MDFMDIRYPFEGRTERLIAVGRVVLASFSLLAIWLDPLEPAKYAGLAYLLLAAYVFYALVICLLVWVSYGSLVRLRLATHIFDLGIFSLFMYFTEGPTSPFFVYFVFSILCATLRWQWRGVLWTAAVALAAYIGMGVYTAEVLHDPEFELNRFIIRSVYLAVIAGMLAFLGAYEQKRRREISDLAAWPRRFPQEAQELVRGLLEYAAGIVKAPRVLMAWDEPEEPSFNLATWSQEEFQWDREPPGKWGGLVSESLANKNFLCIDAGAPTPLVLCSSAAGVERWHGAPIDPDLQARFGIRSTLSLAFQGEALKGRLFFLDKKRITTDDILLGVVVARQVMVGMNFFLLLERLQQMAAAQERVRLADELHDGLLQSMTVMSFKLGAVQRLLSNGRPEEAAAEIEGMEELISGEQRELRRLVGQMKPA